MTTAIDFGCHMIRAAVGGRGHSASIRGIQERSEYIVLPDTEQHQQFLTDQQVSFAQCDESLVVFGNRAGQFKWLNRLPSAPLFPDGQIPTADAPARQILNVMTASILQQLADTDTMTCCFTSPGGLQRIQNIEFLSHLIDMNGGTPLACSSTDALMLASGHSHQFTGVTLVLGAEVCELGISRQGIGIAHEVIPIGGNWIDTELARQSDLKIYDNAGGCYLDLDSVRSWKSTQKPHLRHSYDERGRQLSRLYAVLLDRVAASLKRLLVSPQVTSKIGNQRLNLMCGGGGIQVDGFAGALTEKLVDHEIADQILSVELCEDADTAVLRGLLIAGELEAGRIAHQDAA